jgi:hypothetical protein
MASYSSCIDLDRQRIDRDQMLQISHLLSLIPRL